MSKTLKLVQHATTLSVKANTAVYTQSKDSEPALDLRDVLLGIL